MTEGLTLKHSELIGNNYLLERYVVDSVSGIYPAYSDLPQQLTSTTIETYANWLSELTQNDTDGRERGSLISISTDGQLLFPENPEIGDDAECDWAIYDEPGSKISINTHSHPYDISFSGAYADLTALLSGWSDSRGLVLPTGMLVSTPEHNYLMLKSNETSQEDRHEVYKNAWNANPQSTRRNFIRFGTDTGALIPKDRSSDFRRLFEIAQLEFPDGDFEAYYSSFIDSINLAEIYKMGFYVSEKDGSYIRLTREKVMELLKDKLESALRRAKR